MFEYKIIEQGKGILNINLKGDFDTSAAQTVQNEMESYDYENITKVVFNLTHVTLMASSGLRVIFYAKDKIKDDMIVELKGAQGLVAKVLKMSGIKKFVDIID